MAHKHKGPQLRAFAFQHGISRGGTPCIWTIRRLIRFAIKRLEPLQVGVHGLHSAEFVFPKAAIIRATDNPWGFQLDQSFKRLKPGTLMALQVVGKQPVVQPIPAGLFSSLVYALQHQRPKPLEIGRQLFHFPPALGLVISVELVEVADQHIAGEHYFDEGRARIRFAAAEAANVVSASCCRLSFRIPGSARQQCTGRSHGGFLVNDSVGFSLVAFVWLAHPKFLG
ncbi:hypothetical protein BKN49_05680 [Pseudomonas aeruginosa]|nr:hypothetical protein BKN49_05680 [Pseudomonas aeruginosa]